MHRTDPGARQPGHRVADLVEQPAHDPVAALVDGQLHDRALPRRREHLGRGHLDRAVLEPDPGQQATHRRLLHDAGHLGDVGLLQLVRRVGDPLGEVAVVGQQDEALGVGVEPADVEEPLGPVGDQLAQRATALRVRHRRDHAPGLVERQVDVGRDRRQPLAVDPHHRRGGVDLGAQPGDHLAVDLDEAGEHQLLALAPAGDAGGRQQLLQPDQAVVVGRDRRAWVGGFGHACGGPTSSGSVTELTSSGTASATTGSGPSISSMSSRSGRKGARSGSSPRSVMPSRSRK